MRTWTVAALFFCAFAALSPMVASAASEDDAPVEAALRHALDFVLTQQKQDGSITDTGNPHAMTALALMALGATGHQPTDPDREGEAMRKALDYLLGDNRQRDNGYFGSDGSRMYGHGIVTLALSEMLGMGVSAEQDRRLRQRLTKALELITWAQDRKEKADEEHYGGWRYEPDARDSDLSITIWQLLALRSAKNAGVQVPKSSIDKAVVYVKRAYKPVEDKHDDQKGGACRYQKGRRAEYAAAAAGLVALQVCGIYEGTEVDGSVEFLTNLRPNWDTRYLFYGTYYYAQGLYQRGGPKADEARKTVNALLLPRQEQNGSWQPNDGEERGAGRVYATSMAVLSLAVYQHFLPIYQR